MKIKGFTFVFTWADGTRSYALERGKVRTFFRTREQAEKELRRGYPKDYVIYPITIEVNHESK